MARKRKPILGRAWDLIGSLSITPMAKVRRPIAQKLFLFKIKRSKNRFKLLRHYNHTFVGEYQFSPSDSPLFHHPRPRFQKRSRLLCLLCGGTGGAGSIDNEGGNDDELEILSDGVGREQQSSELSDFLGEEEEDDSSVDRRAENFIERFYEEMRMQRQDSLMQYREMLHKSCS